MFQVPPRSLNYGYNCFIFTASWVEDTPSTKTTHCVKIEPSDLTLAIIKKNPERKLSPNTAEPKKWDTNFTLSFNVSDPDLIPVPGVVHDVNADVRVSFYFPFWRQIMYVTSIQPSCEILSCIQFSWQWFVATLKFNYIKDNREEKQKKSFYNQPEICLGAFCF